MKLNKLAVIGTSLFLVSGMAAADEPSLELSANVSFVSMYMFRGVQQNTNKPALQGGFDASYGGFYAGIWGSNVDATAYANSTLEVDTYLGYGGDLFDTGISYDIGWLRYNYPGTTVSANNTDEYHVGLSYDFGSASVGYTYYYSPEWFGPSEADYNLVSLDVPLPEDFGLSASVGFTNGEATGFDSYTDYSLGVSKSYGGFDFGLSFVSTSGTNSPKPVGMKDQVVFSVGKSF